MYLLVIAIQLLHFVLHVCYSILVNFPSLIKLCMTWEHLSSYKLCFSPLTCTILSNNVVYNHHL